MESYLNNELPYTYDKCKQFTSEFTEWLGHTATARNIEYQTYVESNSTGNAKRQRKEERKIPINEMVKIAEQIAQSGQAPEDMSGYQSLAHAISTRKEVTSYYRLTGKADETHQFFTQRLVTMQNILRSLYKNSRKEHDISDATTPAAVLVSEPRDSPTKESDDESANAVTEAAEAKSTPMFKTSKNRPGADMAKEEVERESSFMVLCFIYDFCILRKRTRLCWERYNDRKIGLMTAAVFTDLTQELVQRHVATVVEELEEIGEERSLPDIVKQLYETASQETPSSDSESQDQRESSWEPQTLFCIKAVHYIEEYQRRRDSPPGDDEATEEGPCPPTYVDYLLFFERFRGGHLNPPILDNFTRGILRSRTVSEPWLPFGFQLIIDVMLTTMNTFNEHSAESTGGSMHLVKLMRAHIEYEDLMWANGTKPEYISVGETKFSNIFLEPISDMLFWLKDLVQDRQKSVEGSLHAMWFMNISPVLGGLILYHFHSIYQSTSIIKTEWFMVSIAHLYNACRQAGGLSKPWPDLEYIIDQQGSKRIFVGERPTDAEDFYHRYMMGICTSMRCVRTESGQRHTIFRKSNQQTREKRGLNPRTPLESKIHAYYYNFLARTRWTRFHNIFAHMAGQEKAGQTNEENISTLEEEVRVEFTALMKILQLKEKRSTRRKKAFYTGADLPRVKEHAELLENLEETLCKNELHGAFDYLDFYRRAYSLIVEIRTEVLFDAEQELLKLEVQSEDPTNFDLLSELLSNLRIKSKAPSHKTNGQEVSKDVVWLEKLRKISKIMEKFIDDEGRSVLDCAEQHLRQWWDTQGERDFYPAC